MSRKTTECARRVCKGAEVVDVTIPGLADLLTDRANGFLVLRQDFKFDLNAYLAAHRYCQLRLRDNPVAIDSNMNREVASASLARGRENCHRDDVAFATTKSWRGKGAPPAVFNKPITQ